MRAAQTRSPCDGGGGGGGDRRQQTGRRERHAHKGDFDAEAEVAKRRRKEAIYEVRDEGVQVERTCHTTGSRPNGRKYLHPPTRCKDRVLSLWPRCYTNENSGARWQRPVGGVLEAASCEGSQGSVAGEWAIQRHGIGRLHVGRAAGLDSASALPPKRGVLDRRIWDSIAAGGDLTDSVPPHSTCAWPKNHHILGNKCETVPPPTPTQEPRTETISESLHALRTTRRICTVLSNIETLHEIYERLPPVYAGSPYFVKSLVKTFQRIVAPLGTRIWTDDEHNSDRKGAEYDGVFRRLACEILGPAQCVEECLNWKRRKRHLALNLELFLEELQLKYMEEMDSENVDAHDRKKNKRKKRSRESSRRKQDGGGLQERDAGENLSWQHPPILIPRRDLTGRYYVGKLGGHYNAIIFRI
ncbi:hypothetical protein F5148DRAFT_1368301 [Russula earlei]|uniref:Uncharacterized protein n=1 Tax=Russula earlei TaxID=71964 RepID=A0ACC0U7H5_9AGAM|nr:hypothetical protein F5148DRAFT_1368301 [Russula earlei]